MKLKIIVLFTLLFGTALSQTTADNSNVNLESIKKFEENLNTVQTDIKKLNKSLAVLDSLFSSNKIDIENKISQLEKSTADQSKNLDKRIKSVNDAIVQIKNELNKKFSSLEKNANHNLSKSKQLDDAIVKANIQIDTLDNYIEKVKDDNKNQINSLDQSVNKTISDRTLYWIIAILLILIIIASVFFFLKSKVAQQQDSISSVKITQEKLENESILLDTKLIQILEQKLEVAQQQPQQTKEIDHSLPLKLGEEIHRMRKRLNTMDESQGTKVLNKRIESLEEKINDMGYEIVDLEGRPFNDGMTIHAQFVADENLKEGESIIRRVIKPQINFNDNLIQAAEVEVAQSV